MDQMIVEYEISSTEIRRRETAYITLVASLSISISAALWIWTKDVSILLYMCPIIILFYLSVLIFKHFFRNYAKTRITLTDEFIERTGYKATEKIFYKDVKSIAVRYTTRGDVRDIIINSQDKTLALDGLENFQQFKNALSTKIVVTIKESNEHLDYDHPFFYAILGILVGFILPFGIMHLAQQSTSWVITIILTYVLIIGLFFLTNHPIAKRYGDKKPLADIIFGIILVCASISLYFLAK